MSESPKVYLLLGPKGSGRRKIFLDLIQELLESSSILWFRHCSDSEASYASINARIEGLSSLECVQWTLENSKIKHSSIKANPDYIFFMAPADVDLAETIEGLKGWLNKNDCTLTRIITVIHSEMACHNAIALKWFEASMHFSDIVLLNKRELVEGKWVQDFISNYKKRYFPTRFEYVKKDQVSNPMDILDHQVYRNSLYFDELMPIEEDEIEELQSEDTKEDPYIERLESGKRVKPIPTL